MTRRAYAASERKSHIVTALNLILVWLMSHSAVPRGSHMHVIQPRDLSHLSLLSHVTLCINYCTDGTPEQIVYSQGCLHAW
jgi:hypothetical protein